MLRNKRFLFIILIVTVLFLLPTVCIATENFTTPDGIKATKIVENTDGTIDFKFENIALSAEGQYTWGIGVTTKAEDVENWYTLADYGEASKTAILTLTPQESRIKQILRTTDTVWLYIKDIKNNNYIVNALRVNLTLPLSKVFPVVENEDTTDFRSFEIKNSVYGIRDIYYKFVKVTDQKIIEKYLVETEDKKEVNSDSYATRSQAPETGWKSIEGNFGSAGLYINPKPTEPGLYYVWIKGKDADSKTILGCNMYYGDVNEPEVERIYVTRPLDGTYATGQTVKIRVDFSEPITGSTVPTLKIKFGDSAVREISNGTIVNSENGLSHFIEYSYDIQATDKGQLATIEYVGGNIKDTSGNDATLSCPLITGYTIKANVEGTNNNQTDNLDKENNNQTPPTTVTLSSIAITKAPNKVSYKAGEKFDKTGMEVTAKYSDGTTQKVTNFTVNPSTELKTVDTKVVISYTENGVTKTVEQEIKVNLEQSNVSLTSINITKTPTKIKYNEGEKFDKTGMEVTAIYSDGNKKQITDYTISPLEKLKTSDKKVVISYTENGVTKTVEQTISVIKKVSEKDSTTKGDSKLPQTGATIMFFAVIASIIFAVISKVKCGKYKDI